MFNWSATLYKGAISFETPMLYAYGFMGLFAIGGLTGLFLATLRGPGKVWLQSLPFSRLASRIFAAAPRWPSSNPAAT